MNEDYKNWNEDEYLTFVLIHAAFADYEIQNEENDIISKILPEDRFKKLITFHKSNKDIDNINIIMSLTDRYCPTSESKKEIHGKIKSLFHADGKYNFYEKNMDRIFDLIF